MEKERMRKKGFLLSLILFCSLIASGFFMHITSVQAFDGAGTKNNPYVISTKADLTALTTNVNAGNSYAGKYFILANNLDLEGETVTPIGRTAQTPFSGVLLGSGKTISNMYIGKLNLDTENSYQGLFGFLDGAEIYNLTLENINVQVLGTVGVSASAAPNNRQGNHGQNGQTNLTVGGLAGVSVNSVISGVRITGTITAQASHGGAGSSAGSRTIAGNGMNGGNGGHGRNAIAGGLIGNAQNTTITSSSFAGSVSAFGGTGGMGGNGSNYLEQGLGGNGGMGGMGGNAVAGGLAGFISSESFVSLSYADVKMYAENGAGGNGGNSGEGSTVHGQGGNAGIGGQTHTGGLVGYAQGSINNSFSVGEIVIKANSQGESGLNINGEYGVSGVEKTVVNVGGIAGTIEQINENSKAVIENTYSTAAIKISEIYSVNKNQNIKKSAIAGSVINAQLINNVAEITAGANMQQLFSQFNFSVWKFSAGVNNGRPVLIENAFVPFNYFKVIQVNTEEELITLRERHNKGYSLYGTIISLGADITLQNNWVPFGNSHINAFQGIVQGNNHKISNLKIESGADYKGFIGIAQNANLSNLVLENVSITSGEGEQAGAFVGRSNFGLTLTNCAAVTSGSIFSESSVIRGSRYVGGLAGFVAGVNNSISKSYNTVFVNAANAGSRNNLSYTGGLLGFFEEGIISQSFSEATVLVNNATTAYYYAGGLVGGVNGKVQVNNCFTTGSVTGGVGIGGFIGQMGKASFGSVIEKSYSSAEVNAAFLGEVTTVINGAFIAEATNGLTVQQCAMLSNSVSVLANSTNKAIGKFVSFTENAKETFIGKNNVYNTNAVITPSAGLGINNTETQAQGYALENLQVLSVYLGLGWNFTSVWTIEEGNFPRLKNTEVLSENNTVIISTAQELIAFANAVNQRNNFAGKTIKLNNSIDLNNEVFTPIGTGLTQGFAGTFDGNGFIISNVKLERTSGYAGLFGYVYNATIKNVRLENIILSGRGEAAGALVGFAAGNTCIENVGLNNSNIVSEADAVGGLVGWAQNVTLKSLAVTNTYLFGGNTTGGLVGKIAAGADRAATLVNSYNTSHVSGKGNIAGGLVGSANGVVISNSYNTGNVHSNEFAGGIAGELIGFSSTILNAMVNANVGVFTLNGGTVAAGGVVGAIKAANSLVINTIYTGSVKTYNAGALASSVAAAGGVVGLTTALNVRLMQNAVLAKNIESFTANKTAIATRAIIGAGLGNNNATGGSNIHVNNINLSALKNINAINATSNNSAAKTSEQLKTTAEYLAIGFNIGTEVSKVWRQNSLLFNYVPYLSENQIPSFEEGHENNPKAITNKQQLINLANMVNSGNNVMGSFFEVKNSIQIGTWENPIGKSINTPFNGNFNGNGFVLSGLTSNLSQEGGEYGLFGVAATATIKNVLLGGVNINIAGGAGIGDKAGALLGRAFANVTIKNCSVINGKLVSGGINVGGLIGAIENSENTVEKCFSGINVTGGAQAGGLIGLVSGTAISQSYASGTVTTNHVSFYGVGGLVGILNGQPSTITNCYATGAVSDNSSITYAVAGGLVGILNSNGSLIKNSYSSGAVTARTSWQSMVSPHGAYAGGLAGLTLAAASFENCVVLNKTITAEALSAHTALAAIVAPSSTAVRPTATNTFYIRTLVTSGGVGYISGVNNGLALERTVLELISASTYANSVAQGGLGWSVGGEEKVWSVYSANNNGYPYLNGLAADKTDLINLTEAAKNEQESYWNQTTFAALQQAIANSEVMIAAENITATQINTSRLNLLWAIEDLRPNKTNLQNLYNNYVINYSPFAFVNKNTINASLLLTEEVLDENSNKFNNLDVQEVYNLFNSAINGLKADKTELGQLLLQTNELQQSHYTASSWQVFMTAKNEATNVFNETNANAVKVNNAVTELRNAIGLLKTNIEALNHLITTAQGYVEGLTPETFTAASYSKFAAALLAAQQKTNASSLNDVTNAFNNLNFALNNLTFDMWKLAEKYNEYSRIDNRFYTIGSYSVFSIKLTQAKDVLKTTAVKPEDFKITAEKIEQALQQLVSAKSALVVNKQELFDMLEIAENQDPAVYVADGSWDALQVEIASANNLKNQDLTALQVESMVIALQRAVYNLNLNTEWLGLLVSKASTVLQGYYTEVSYQSFLAALSEAAALVANNNKDITQIKEAYNNLTNKLDALAVDSEIISNYVVLINNLNYSLYAEGVHALLAELKQQAQTVLNAGYANISDSNKAYLKLIDKLELTFNNLPANKTQLLNAVCAAEKINNSKYIINNGSLLPSRYPVYTVASWQNFTSVLNATKNVLYNSKATPQQVQSAESNLASAIAALQVNTLELTFLMGQADAILAESYKYTANSIETLRQVRNTVNDTLFSLNSLISVEIYNNLFTLLSNAINGITAYKAQVQQLITSYYSLPENDYTITSYLTFIRIVNYAEEFIQGNDITVADVAAINSLLLEAYQKLVPSKEALTALTETALKLNANFVTNYNSLWQKLEKAMSVINKLNATFAEVKVSEVELRNALNGAIANKAKLAQIIDLAQASQNLDYLPESLAVLFEITQSAQAIYLNANATVLEVVAAHDAVYSAINTLQVNTTRLQALINNTYNFVNRLVEESNTAVAYYTSDTLNNVYNILNLASNKLNTHLTLSEMTTLMQNITAAVNLLETNKTQLNNLIAVAETYKANYFTSGSFNLLASAISQAKALAANRFAGVEELVDMRNELSNAINVLGFNQTALSELITQAQSILQTPAYYAANSLVYLTNALNTALAYNPNTENYNSVARALERAVYGAVDFRPLQTSLLAAETFTTANHTAYTRNDLNFALSGYERLLNAITAGRDALTNAYITQAEMQTVLGELNFNTYIVNIGQLKAAYSTAQSYYDYLYTTASFKLLTAAKDTALQVLNNVNATQAEVNAAEQLVITAMNGLVPVLFVRTLSDLYNEVKEYKEIDYTASSFASFRFYLTQAEAVISNSSVSRAIAREVFINLSQSVNNLVYVKGLKDLINAYSQLPDYIYTSNSYAHFLVNLTTAKVWAENAEATDLQIKEATQQLITFREALVIDIPELTRMYEYALTVNGNDAFKEIRAAAGRALAIGQAAKIIEAFVQLYNALY